MASQQTGQQRRPKARRTTGLRRTQNVTRDHALNALKVFPTHIGFVRIANTVNPLLLRSRSCPLSGNALFIAGHALRSSVYVRAGVDGMGENPVYPMVGWLSPMGLTTKCARRNAKIVLNEPQT